MMTPNLYHKFPSLKHKKFPLKINPLNLTKNKQPNNKKIINKSLNKINKNLIIVKKHHQI